MNAVTEKSKLVDMSWDPVTRMVGSLGIHTKIDFDNRQVAECYSTSSIFRGYSMFRSRLTFAQPPIPPIHLRFPTLQFTNCPQHPSFTMHFREPYSSVKSPCS
jgi:hypothetical protein